MSNYINHDELIHFKGAIWTNKSFNTESRGNIYLKNLHTGEFQVLAYISPSELKNHELKDVVKSNLKSLGLINLLELEDESIITCSVCGFTFDEANVNIMDYDLDLCVQCEKKHLKTVTNLSR